jgi:hypothetical protein
MGAAVIESLPEGAGVVRVGTGSFVMPWLEFRATPSQVARLEVAALLGAANDSAARQLLADIESEMAKEARRRAKTPPEGRVVAVPRHLFAEEGPLALVPAQVLGLPVARTSEGRVYAPDPMRSRPVDRQGDDQDPLADERARLDHATMDNSQAWRLATADFYADRVDALRAARPKGARIGMEEKAAANTARRILLRLRRELLETGEADAVRARRLNAEHLADQDGRAVRRQAMCNRRARLIEAGLNRWDRVRHLWAYRASLRAAVTRRNIDGLSLVALTPIQRACAEWYRSLYERTERGARVASWEGRTGSDLPRPERCRVGSRSDRPQAGRGPGHDRSQGQRAHDHHPSASGRTGADHSVHRRRRPEPCAVSGRIYPGPRHRGRL